MAIRTDPNEALPGITSFDFTDPVSSSGGGAGYVGGIKIFADDVPGMLYQYVPQSLGEMGVAFVGGVKQFFDAPQDPFNPPADPPVSLDRRDNWTFIKPPRAEPPVVSTRRPPWTFTKPAPRRAAWDYVKPTANATGGGGGGGPGPSQFGDGPPPTTLGDLTSSGSTKQPGNPPGSGEDVCVCRRRDDGIAGFILSLFK